MGLLPDTQNCVLRMHRECRERFSPPPRVSDPTCITVHASCTCRGACRDRWLVVSFEVGGGEIVPGIPGACATRNFAYLVRGPLLGNSRCQDIWRHGHDQGQVQYMHRPLFGWPTGYWWQQCLITNASQPSSTAQTHTESLTSWFLKFTCLHDFFSNPIVYKNIFAVIIYNFFCENCWLILGNICSKHSTSHPAMAQGVTCGAWMGQCYI